jgi:hypothetical protein
MRLCTLLLSGNKHSVGLQDTIQYINKRETEEKKHKTRNNPKPTDGAAHSHSGDLAGPHGTRAGMVRARRGCDRIRGSEARAGAAKALQREQKRRHGVQFKTSTTEKSRK